MDVTRRFADTFAVEQGSSIAGKITFSVTMSWICVSVIYLSGLIIIPFMGKIQERMFQLMKVFFDFDKTH
jgi:hypothetical protein